VKPRICVPLPVNDLSSVGPLIRKAEAAGANLIELRLDYLEADASERLSQLNRIIDGASVPLIATNRHHSQGGQRLQDEKQRIRILIQAAKLRFEYVDVELTTFDLRSTIRKIKSYGAKPIVSFHDSKGTPEVSEMERIVKSQVKAGATVCKLVTAANSLGDSVKCLLLTYRMNQTADIVCFAMGRKGLLSRAISPLMGACFTFASLESSLETASGQISIAELTRLYRQLGVYE
jgi:3-dehydroquinate dehydratase type I